jgi:hypothetical protein
MRIVEQHSHLGGYEHLLIHKPKLWAEFLEAVASIDASNYLADSYLYSNQLGVYFQDLLISKLWIKSAQHYLLKNRIAIELQFGNCSSCAYTPFAKHLAFYVGDQIDVGIEILPMKSLQSQMASGVPYYEKGLYDVVRQGRGVPAVPLVVVGVEP